MRLLRVLIVATMGLAPAAQASAPNEIPSAFLVSKTENKNQVHYAVRVDDACMPLGPAPVRAYWRMLERGPNATEPLTDREQRAYGIARQTNEGSSVRVVLQALPAKSIAIRTWRAENGTCSSAALTTIANRPARLFNVHIVLKLFGVDYLLVTGWADDGSVVRERIKP